MAAESQVLDAQVLNEFLTESYENLDQLDRDFVALEKDPTELERIAGIFRTIHTLKGTAGFLSLTKLGALAHAGESLLSLLRDGKLQLTPATTSTLLSMVDGVRAMLKNLEASGGEGDEAYSEVIAALAACCAGTPPAAPPLTAAPPEAATPAPSPTAPRLPPAMSVSATVAPLPLFAPTPAVSITTMPGRTEAPPVHSEAPAGVADTTIRVDVGLLDKLMNLVGELVLARNQILQVTTQRHDAVLQGASQRLNLVTSELQEGVMRTRMQPIAGVWNKLPRVVRDLSVACGKQVELVLEGKETELDRTIIEAIKDPLTHIVRNSIDHGIEAPEARRARGKPATGCLRLRAFHEGGQVNIEIADDGAGLDPERIRRKAIERGLLGAERSQGMSERDLWRFIFMPGFSTAEKVTNVSGRGVGMDVVKTNIERIGGTIDLSSRAGEGTTLKIKIPLTLAIIPALIVSLGEDRYAIPQVSLLELVRIESGDVARRIENIQGAPVLRLRDKLLPLIDLRRVLEEPARAETLEPVVSVVILQADDRVFGLVVDGVHDTEEIVVKPLGRELKALTTFAGATILGDGRVALICDVAGIARRAEVLSEGGDHSALSHRGKGAQITDDVSDSLLLLRRGSRGRLALPLAHVARLEEFPRDAIEAIGSRRVMQYRGEILPLVSLDGVLGPSDSAGDSPTVQVVVLSHAGGTVGLEIDDVLDIVHESVTVKTAGVRPGVRGTAVIQGRVTELLDVREAMSALGVGAC